MVSGPSPLIAGNASINAPFDFASHFQDLGTKAYMRLTQVLDRSS